MRLSPRVKLAVFITGTLAFLFMITFGVVGVFQPRTVARTEQSR